MKSDDPRSLRTSVTTLLVSFAALGFGCGGTTPKPDAPAPLPPSAATASAAPAATESSATDPAKVSEEAAEKPASHSAEEAPASPPPAGVNITYRMTASGLVVE